MKHYGGILGRGTNFDCRFFEDYAKAAEATQAVRKLGQTIVLTSGTFDVLHVDHMTYLERSRALGTFLVVGVDSDAKVRSRKGPTRPFVPQMERAQMLAHQRHVDMIVLKPELEEPRLLLKTIRPDILVISETTGHEDGEVEEMRKYCGKVEFLPSSKSTSTTASLRKLLLGGFAAFTQVLQDAIPDLMQRALSEIDGERKKEVPNGADSHRVHAGSP